MDRYERRGVSSAKPEVHAAIAQLDKGRYPGAFCQIMPYDAKRGAVKHSDGAGTKAGLGYLAWKYGGFPLSIWRGISQDSLVMNCDDVACVGAVGGKKTPFYVTQAINRNPFLIPGEVLAELVAGAVDFQRLMADFGVNIILAGGETADVADLVRTITVDNDLFTTIPFADVIDANRIEEGDVIVGFSSTGQALWEKEPNSGIGSNGLTNARHDSLAPEYRQHTETYSPEIPGEDVYCGSYKLSDPLPGDNSFTVGSALLSPTRTYLPLISKLILICRSGLHGLIHCSGGGQTKIGKFGNPGLQYLKHNLLPIPPLFRFLQEVRGLSWEEMLKSYNCGHRLEAVMPLHLARECIRASDDMGIDCDIIGEVRERKNGYRVIIDTEYGRLRY